MSSPEQNIDVYTLDNCFDRRALQSADGRRKAQLFKAMVPAGCQSILDAGGGTGWATIGLRKRYTVVTLDSSLSSLMHGQGARVLGNVSNLPFADKSFDMVISSQVLEHLPDAILTIACAEMTRVASKYLLVSVPYRENLSASAVRCLHCREVFHPDYHLHSFSEQRLSMLLEGWVMAEWHVFGALLKETGANLQIDNQPPGSKALPDANEYTICPSCGRQGGGLKYKFKQRLTALVSSRTSRRAYEPDVSSNFLPQVKAPYWIAALFIPQDSVPTIDGCIEELV